MSLHTQLRKGAIVDVAAPRGEFVLTDGKEPIVLISAGVGATPVLAMLHALAAEQSPRDIWWIHVARDRANHAFAAEAHQLLQSLPRATEYVHYTATSGRPSAATLVDLHVPIDADAYLCGPELFMTALRDALVGLGVDAGRIRTELFGARTAINPGLTDARHTPPHQPPGPPGVGPQITFARSGLATRCPASTARCSSSPTPATSPPDGRAAPVSATPASRRSSPATSATPRPRWSCPAPGKRSSAAPTPAPTSSSTSRRSSPRCLWLEPVNEVVDVGHGDGERRVALSPKRRRNRLTEVHADARAPIGPERQSVVDP